MTLDRINLTRRLIAALGDATWLATETGMRNRIAAFSELREKAAKDLGEVVRNAYNNGGITEAQAKSAMCPIYSTANEVHHGGF
ncbi:hypothetical protein [Streptomyces sp. A1-5]|uniref:hypothetical protein n=1 Tax=Streptomyces sp. A1-5 TaxID=2738410 RepID=UPI001F4553B3|nr:hypothetical protein [Streptomyces sp. A1-5]UJB43448.1 hypothetical protein HRD51_23930 [Streptomyces sp. A1-5]